MRFYTRESGQELVDEIVVSVLAVIELSRRARKVGHAAGGAVDIGSGFA